MLRLGSHKNYQDIVETYVGEHTLKQNITVYFTHLLTTLNCSDGPPLMPSYVTAGDRYTRNGKQYKDTKECQVNPK